MATPPPLTDLLIHDAMIHAVKEVFLTMARMEIVLVERTNEVASPVENGPMQIIGNVGFGGTINGLVYLCMPQDFAYTVAARTLQMDALELAAHGSEGITDTIGEITNMTVGTFKNRLVDLGYPCKLTVPSMVRGRGLSVKGIKGTKRHVFHFDTLGERVTADLHMAE